MFIDKNVIPHLPALDCDRGMRNPEFPVETGIQFISSSQLSLGQAGFSGQAGE